jgi:serine/threonine-protein kinase
VIGLRLNNYEVVSILGEGGMGTVYLARHTYMGRRAAIKLLRPELLRDESVVARFLDEARATNAIHHPNIIDIIDVGMLSDGRTPYLMMEFLDGESLAARLGRSRALPIHEAVEITCQTASALAAAHTRGIIHRDLKPDNLFLVPDETMVAKERVKVLDFGIAKLRGDVRGGAVRTQTGAIMGTPQYMSPEQCRGFSEAIDHRTDIYALGIILYEMLCGQAPFVSEGLGDILLRHMTEVPAPLCAHVPEIPESLERAVLRALAKNPDERFDSMADFARAVREYDSKVALTARAAGPKDPRDKPTAMAATVLARSVTPPPVLVSSGITPAPVRVPYGTTPPPEVVFALAPDSGARPAGAPVPRTVGTGPADPTWVPRPDSVGAHTTLSAHTGQIAAATARIPPRRSPRRLMIGVAVGGLAVIGVVAVLVLRSPSPATVGRPAAPAAVARPPLVEAPAPAVAPLAAPAPAASTGVPDPALSAKSASAQGKKAAKRRGKAAAGPASLAAPPREARPASAPAPASPPAHAPLPTSGPRAGGKW